MNDNLTQQDYIDILNYYKKKIPKSKQIIKMNAEKILRDKLCRCIKKMDFVNESKSIGICTRSVLNKKGFARGKFNCTGRRSTMVIKKMKKNRTIKKRN